MSWEGEGGGFYHVVRLVENARPTPFMGAETGHVVAGVDAQAVSSQLSATWEHGEERGPFIRNETGPHTGEYNRKPAGVPYLTHSTM